MEEALQLVQTLPNTCPETQDEKAAVFMIASYTEALFSYFRDTVRELEPPQQTSNKRKRKAITNEKIRKRIVFLKKSKQQGRHGCGDPACDGLEWHQTEGTWECAGPYWRRTKMYTEMYESKTRKTQLECARSPGYKMYKMYYGPAIEPDIPSQTICYFCNNSFRWDKKKKHIP